MNRHRQHPAPWSVSTGETGLVKIWDGEQPVARLVAILHPGEEGTARLIVDAMNEYIMLVSEQPDRNGQG